MCKKIEALFELCERVKKSATADWLNKYIIGRYDDPRWAPIEKKYLEELDLLKIVASYPK